MNSIRQDSSSTSSTSTSSPSPPLTSSSSTSSSDSHHNRNSTLIPNNSIQSQSNHNTIIDIDPNFNQNQLQSQSPIPISTTSTYLHHSHHHHYYHHHHHQEPSVRTNSLDQLLNLHLPSNHPLINQLHSSPSASSHQPHHPVQDPEEDDEDDTDDEEEDSSSSYVPRSSLVVEDYDERGFGSSAESDVSSSGILDEPGETTRMLKRKKSNPILEPSSASSRAESPTPLPSLYWSSSQSNTSVPLNPHHHSQGTFSNIGEPDYLLTDASSTCLAQLGDPHSSLSSNQPPNVLVNDGHPNRYHSQYFHSHHYRTSVLPRKNPSHLPTTHHAPSQSSLSGVESLTPRDVSNTTTDSPRRSKRGWFSSRRQKRKNSIHALSTSSLSSTSLHSPPFHDTKQEFHSTKQHEYKYLNSSSSRRSRSTPSTLRRMSRSMQSFGLSSIFFARQVSIPTRRPITIFAGLIIIIGLIAGITTFLIHFLDTDKEPLPWRTYCQEQREFPHEFADSLAPVNVFVGVFSIDSAYERRHLIRSTYARHSRPIDPTTGRPAHNVQLKFVLGKPRIQHARRVALEMETFNDIVILEIPENMNRGKTYAYFRWASENATIPFYYRSTSSGDKNETLQLEAGDHKQDQKVSVGFRKADFVVKADDDAFIVLRELERHLRVAPRNKTYWGYLIRNLFMGGECYALSSDLVDYVASSASVLNHLTGAEDKKVAKWMRIHPNATSINWVTEKCWIYDHPKAGTTYAHGFLFPDEVRRVREEGKRGLTEAEIQSRGYDWPQAYSTVTRWKERYLPPRSRMTMEEEVEDLVEGGGKFNRTDWRSSDINQKPLVRIDEVLFDANDYRLQLPTILSTLPEEELRTKGVAEHGSFSSGVLSSNALLRSSGPQEPSIPLKFGRPPSELLAPLPALEDLPESDFKQALERVVKDNERVELNHQKENKMIGLPSVRFDEDESRLRDIRFEGRKNGGTVVVHYLKRNEWFLETQLVLLGKSYTWDSGLEPMDHISRIEQATIGTKNKLEVIESGNERFGGARMYGSPLIELDGTIKVGEGSQPEEVVPEPDLAIRKTIEGGAGWVRGKPRIRVSDLENGPDFSSGKEEEKEEEKVVLEEEDMSEIVKDSGTLQSHLTSTPLSTSSSSSSLPTSLTATDSSELSRGRGIDQQIRLPDDQSEILNNRPTLEHLQVELNLNDTGIDI